MNSSLRNLIIVVIAMIAGGLTITCVEYLIASIEWQNDLMHPGKLALVVVAHALGALVSGIVIGKFAKLDAYFYTLIAGMIWTLVGIAQIITIPHPIWFSVADTCVYLPMTILGAKLASKLS
ncbi:MAG: hypothetical protein WAT26_00890 [Saprospiraceae bacterium]